MTTRILEGLSSAAERSALGGKVGGSIPPAPPSLLILLQQSLDKIRVMPGQEQLLTHLPEGRVSIHRRKSDDRLVLILRNGGLPVLSKPVAFWGRDYSRPHGGCWKPAFEIEQTIQQFLMQIKKGF